MWAFQSPSQALPMLPNCRSSVYPKLQSSVVALRPVSAIAGAATAVSENSNPLIQSLCKHGKPKQALELLANEPSPTQHTYELLILSCAHRSSLSDALAVHRHISDHGFDQDPFLASKLIDMYGELDCIDRARGVFDEIRSKTLFVWNAILRTLALRGHGEVALNLYRRMNRRRIPSDKFTYTYVLKACVASESIDALLQKGKEIHAHVLRHGLAEHLHTMTTLLDVYARFGRTSNARAVFDAMPVRNVVSWSAMIGCYARNDQPLEALELFHDMVLKNTSLLPNSVTMVSLLQACAALCALEHGKSTHCYILRRGLDSILPVCSTLVTMYAKCGNLKSGQRVFDQRGRRDVVMWNSLLSGYGDHGFGQKAVEIFHEMVGDGISPSSISFLSVLGACSHSGLVEEGKKLFKSMRKEHGIDPRVEHYACMVDLLGRANRLEEAARLIDDMPIKPGPRVWGSLLGSCRIHRNVELAEMAGERLFELEPTNAGNYVLLADVYAAANLWDGVKRVKTLLEVKGLQRITGCSWIEVGKKAYGFRQVDEFNPEMEQLHASLLELSKEMKGKGYELEAPHGLDTVLGHSEKLAVAFGLINCGKGEAIRISKDLRLCEDCHTFAKFISKFKEREILIRDVNRFHHFRDGICSCRDYW